MFILLFYLSTLQSALIDVAGLSQFLLSQIPKLSVIKAKYLPPPFSPSFSSIFQIYLLLFFAATQFHLCNSGLIQNEKWELILDKY